MNKAKAEKLPISKPTKKICNGCNEEIAFMNIWTRNGTTTEGICRCPAKYKIAVNHQENDKDCHCVYGHRESK